MKNDFLTGSKKLYATLIGGTVFLIVAFAVGAVVASAATFKNFSSEFYIAGVDVGGKTVEEAEKLVEQKITQLSHGVTVDVPGLGAHVIEVKTAVIDINETMASARQVDSRGVLTKRVRDWIGVARRTDAPLALSNDAKKIVSEDVLGSWRLALASAVNAKFEISGTGVSVVPAVSGQTIDREDLSQRFVGVLERGENRVTASIIEQPPEITTQTAEALRPAVAALVGEITKGRTLTIKGKSFAVSAADLTALLQPRIVDGKPTVGIDPEMFKALLGTQLGSFEQKPQNAEFEQKGNRVTKFVAPENGVVIDWDTLAKDVFASLSSNVTSTIAVATKETEPEIPLEKLNNLGLKEVVGVGYSNFAGSPKNRRHNISIGINTLKGVLVAPGETFSLMKALGSIDGAAGYLQELVIKENKTIPEYGGGLCQIGTTTFRAAMAAGFSIVMRRNHSYAVPYYFENGLPGTDATIYDPNPDFRFQNDTKHWVMLDPRIKGDDIEFYIWGTSDGRKASRTVPKILSKTPPPPKKIIETTTLAPGVVKCTEKAHTGFSTTFTYTVEYVDGTLKKQDFSSYYKPWGEVCLVGVATSSTIESVSPPILGPL